MTSVYWRPKLAKGVHLNLLCALHYDGYGVGWQQEAQITVDLNSRTFDKKDRRKKQRQENMLSDWKMEGFRNSASTSITVD